ncbi:ABC transporter substrate-binding protein [Chloroflexota bacterium]
MRIQRTGLVLLLVLVVLLSACDGGEPEVESYTIGVINAEPQIERAIDGFKAGMTDHGYTEGENITYVYNGLVTLEDLPTAAQALVDAEVDLILATASPETMAVQAVAGDIPIIFSMVFDPVGDGLVEDLNQPGGNTTGVKWNDADARRFELLLELDPTIEVVYLPYNENSSGSSYTAQVVAEAAAVNDIELVTRPIAEQDDLPQAVADIPEDADAIYFSSDRLTLSALEDWIAATVQRQIPISVPGGGDILPILTMGYGSDVYASGVQASRLADQVLKGTDAGSLPVENAEYFMSISLPAAEVIGLEVPDALLEQADMIIRAEE